MRFAGTFVVTTLALATSWANAAVEPAGWIHPGALDVTFGSRGRVAFASPGLSGPSFLPFALAEQADGRIVFAGLARPCDLSFCSTGHDDVALGRLEPNGSADRSFGLAGSVITDLGLDDQVFALAIQDDGKILAVGASGVQQDLFPFHRLYDWAVMRYLPDGRLDPSFGNGGVVRTDFGADDRAWAIGIQSDGKIVVAGSTQDVEPVYSWSDFAVARYGPDGTLDPTFGTGGMVITSSPGDRSHDEARDLVIQPDGRILVTGSIDPADPFTQSDFATVRYLPDGSLDGTFGVMGHVITDLGGDIEGSAAIARQADGRIVLAGSTGSLFNRDFALVRYHADGRLDRSFGTDGVVRTELHGSDFAADIALERDGRMLVAGFTEVDPSPRQLDWALARYLPDGRLDASFGDGGTVTADLGSDDDSACCVSVLADGRALLLGWANARPRNRKHAAVLARYLTSGLLLQGPYPGVAGTENGLLVGGATPGAEVTFVAGEKPGASDVVGCPGLTVGIVDPMMIGRAVAGDRGTAVFLAAVPPAWQGATVLFQAVDRSGCTLSNLSAHTFTAPPRSGDDHREVR
jgi:uncharacterized delta-60 repeat protein